jgi:hypothetical protein
MNDNEVKDFAKDMGIVFSYFKIGLKQSGVIDENHDDYINFIIENCNIDINNIKQEVGVVDHKYAIKILVGCVYSAVMSLEDLANNK